MACTIQFTCLVLCEESGEIDVENLQQVQELWYSGSVGQGLQELPQLRRRKLGKALLHLALLPLHEDPARHAVAVHAHEVDSAPDGTQRGVRLRFQEHVPVLVAAPQLAHLPRTLLAGKRETHGGKLYAPSRNPAS